MVMPERDYSPIDYRFGFNGKETDRETNWQDYGFRIYYPGLGKFLSLDPLMKSFPYYSPFHFAGNRPIVAFDLDGLEDVWVHTYKNPDGSIGSMEIFKGDDNYVATRVQLAQDLGVDLSKLPESGALSTYGEQREHGGPVTNIRYDYQPTVVVTESRSIWNVMSDFGTEMDHRYYGEAGFKQLGEDLSDGGTMVQVAGYATTLMGAPEVGLPLITLGNGMSLTGDAAEVTSNINDGNLGEAAQNVAIAFGKRALGNYISGKIISGTRVTGEVSKKIIETNIDLKIEGTEKLLEKVTDECNTKP